MELKYFFYGNARIPKTHLSSFLWDCRSVMALAMRQALMM